MKVKNKMQNNLEIFAERFSSLRMGLSQGEFARCIGIGQVSVSQYERGDREPSLSKLKQIAERLGVSADWLLGLTDERTPPRGGVANSATASPGAVVGNGAWRGADCASCPLMLAAAQTMKAVAAASSAPPRKKR